MLKNCNEARKNAEKTRERFIYRCTNSEYLIKNKSKIYYIGLTDACYQFFLLLMWKNHRKMTKEKKKQEVTFWAESGLSFIILSIKKIIVRIFPKDLICFLWNCDTRIRSGGIAHLFEIWIAEVDASCVNSCAVHEENFNKLVQFQTITIPDDCLLRLFR